MLTTAIGLFDAIVAAILTAASGSRVSTSSIPTAFFRMLKNSPITSARLPCTTSLTNPISLASAGPNSRPVRASSRALEPLPTILGKRWRVPMSAARPTLTSLEVVSLQSRYGMTAGRRPGRLTRVGDRRGTYHDAELGVRRAETNVAGRRQVNGEAEREAMHGTDDGLGAEFQSGNRPLEVLWPISDADYSIR